MATMTKQNLPLLLRLLPWITGCVLVVAGVTAWRIGLIPIPRAEQSARSNNGLTIASDRLDFGETWESSHFNWTLPIENSRGHDVEIQDFASSCNCSKTEPRSLVIPAGQTREVLLTLDLTAERSKLPDSEWRDFEVTIRPRVQGDPQNALEGWKLRGRVHTAIRLDKPVVDFGRHSEVSQPVPPQKVLVTSYVPLQRLIAISNSDTLKVQVKPLPDAPERFELVIAPAELPTGPIRFEVTVVPQLSDGLRLPGKSLPVTGRIVSEFQASPPAVLFGARPVGETAEETVTLHSLSGQEFDVMGTTVQGEGLAVEEAPADMSGAPAFVLKQQITKTGEQAGRITFRVRTREGKVAELVVPVSYLGISAPKH